MYYKKLIADLESVIKIPRLPLGFMKSIPATSRLHPSSVAMPGQLWCRLTAIAALTSYALAKPLGHWSVQENANLNTKCLLEQDNEAFDSGDISYIKRIAAAGDSYSAGIGAGYQLGNVNPNPYVPGGSSTAADGRKYHPLRR
jgi:hypothetical protein